MDVAIHVGYGWVIREDNEFVNDAVVDAFAPRREEWKNRLSSWLDDALHDAGIEVKAEYFGHVWSGCAILAEESMTTLYRWKNALDDLKLPSVFNSSKFDAELQDAVDLLDLHEARLGSPTWLLLVSYG